MRCAVARLHACIAALLAVACGGGQERPTGAEEQPYPRVTYVEVEPSLAELSAIGATRDFGATARDQDGDTMAGVDFSWSVGTDRVASVGEDGTVTSAANGTTAVIARASGVADSATLVVEQEVATVRVSPDSARAKVVGGSVDFDATALDPNDHPVRGTEYTWSSSDTTVAVVDDGVATTRGEGSASIAASVGDVRGSARLVVRRPADRLVRDFPSFTGGQPLVKPRLDVAASPRRVIVVNGGFQFRLYSKSGDRLAEGDVRSVFGDSARAGTKTRVVYDPDARRFFIAGGTGPASEDEPGQFLLMVSTVADPTDFGEDDWHRFVVEADPEGETFDEAHPARPRLGVSRDAVVLESFMAESQGPGAPCFTRIVILDKAEVLDGDITGKSEIDVGKSDDQYCPDLVPVKSSHGVPLFVNSQGGLEVWGIEDPLSDPALEQTEVTGAPEAFTGRYAPPDAPQPDTDQDLITFTGVTAQPIRSGSAVWAAGTERVETEAGARSGIRWARMDVSDWPASVRVETSGLFHSEHYAIYPAIAGNEDGDFVVIYGRSSEEEFPSLYYRYGDASWPGDSISGPQLLKDGEGSLTIGDGRVPYGTFFGASLDPVDRSAWVVGEYVIDHDSWGSRVGRVAF